MPTRIFSLPLVWLTVFGAAKVAFAVLCRGHEALTCRQMLCAWWHGLPLDLSTTGYFVSLPLLVAGVCVLWPRLPLRRILVPWHAVTATATAAAIVADVALYPFWGFKLDATVLAYITSPAQAVASVSWLFVTVCLTAFVLIAVCLTWLLCMATPRRMGTVSRWWAVAVPPAAAMLFVIIRGGTGEGTMNVGTAYHSQRLFLNHTAVNPVFSFVASASRADDYAAQFDLLPETERKQVFDALYPALTDDTVQAARRRPNVMIVLWESCGASFFAPLGGHEGVTPGLEQLAADGLYFSRFYCNSYRTDRALVSALSGWFSYPTLTLMRLPAVTDRLPCIGNSFARAGYKTFFMYGGDISFTHMGGYVVGGGYQKVVSDGDFTASERRTGQWGVTDSITFDRLREMMAQHQEAGTPWMGTMLTLSSHEPFDVPYHRLDDEIDNAVAYTDHCLSRLIESMKQDSALWHNTLVVVLPDHGMRVRVPQMCEELFRAPMVWTGGALLRRGQVDRLMNQSDLAATLLAAVGLPHEEFEWSRNVLSADYRDEFVYCTSSDGIMLADSTGCSLFDTQAMRPISPVDTRADSLRLHRAKAILQTSYDIVGDNINANRP